ncbi:choice-of-anchor P family protein [Actinoallomurus sp. NBC_01490]|uniref:choice-of-anchor P family protein n=1 Tax=Actinoallomurus sp. NBC_01490 TaxID=2903557 RepID=UPI002E36F892|nr:choice-of-anchor P family protein [Actinoallomurus sp. NBC_01490]
MRATRLTKYAALAGALAAPLSVASPASASGPASSAYGIYAGGALAIPAQPAVTSATQPHRKALELPKNPVFNLALFTVEAKGHHASASVLDLKLSHPGLKTKLPTGLLSAQAIAAKCDNGVGSAHLADISVAGHDVPIGGPPNTDVVIPTRGFGLRVTPDKQVQNPDGTLTVIALELDISIGGSIQTIDLASATCGRADGKPAPTPTVPGTKSSSSSDSAAAGGTPSTVPVKEAPRPTPVPMDLPVTG